MTPLSILECAHTLIEDEANWCRYAGQIGDHIFCSAGAVYHIARHTDNAAKARQILTDHLPRGVPSIIDYNDSHKHFQVMRWWRLTIASVKAGGKTERALQRRIRQQVINMRPAYDANNRLDLELQYASNNRLHDHV